MLIERRATPDPRVLESSSTNLKSLLRDRVT
jgi:hypothetical protein